MRQIDATAPAGGVLGILACAFLLLLVTSPLWPLPHDPGTFAVVVYTGLSEDESVPKRNACGTRRGEWTRLELLASAATEIGGTLVVGFPCRERTHAMTDKQTVSAAGRRARDGLKDGLIPGLRSSTLDSRRRSP